MKKALWLIVGPLLIVGVFYAYRVYNVSESPDVALASLAEMPQVIQEAPASVRRAYQFAAANPQVLQKVPCYCGCGGMGHTSVHSCYVADGGPSGQTRYDSHALGCSICVDIVLDALRLTEEGMTPEMIRFYVDTNYSRYGPSNIL